MMGDNDTKIGGTIPQHIMSCLATMDMFLQQPHPVLCSAVLPEKHKSTNDDNKAGLIEVVANILGVKDVSSVNGTLADLGMDSLMGTEIKQTLERNYDIMLSPQEIRILTFAKLQELSSSTGETNKPLVAAKFTMNSDENAASNMLMMEWPDNEVLPKEALVQFKTKNANGTPLFIVHAIEGSTKPLEYIANELERPLFGLQSVECAPHDTIQELAEFYIKKIREIQKKGPYHVAGYSFGSCVAIEMTLQLEFIGEKVILSLIDGSLEFVRQQCKMIGKVDTTNHIASDGCMKALAYFGIQFNKNINYSEVSTITPTDLLVYLCKYILILRIRKLHANSQETRTFKERYCISLKHK